MKNLINKLMIMKTDYQKINTLFLRDTNSIIMPEHFTCHEFEYLKNVIWECTEKIDGTNIHCDIFSDGTKTEITIHGRTEKAVIPSHLLKKLEGIFTTEAISATFEKQINEATPESPFYASIYGEGYGVKIQKGGNYIKDGVGFILFDVKIGNWWLKRDACEEIASMLNVPIVPIMGYMTIPEAIEFVKAGFKSTIAENKEYDAEGLVLKTPDGLLFRNGERIITKIKTCDFQKYRAKYGDGPVTQFVNPHYNS